MENLTPQQPLLCDKYTVKFLELNNVWTRDVVSVETSRWSRITNVSAEKYVSDPVGLVSGDICGLDIFVYSVFTISVTYLS